MGFTEHRAIVNLVNERTSMAIFCSLNLDGENGPAPRLVTSETPAVFRKIVCWCHEYSKWSRRKQLISSYFTFSKFKKPNDWISGIYKKPNSGNMGFRERGREGEKEGFVGEGRVDMVWFCVWLICRYLVHVCFFCKNCLKCFLIKINIF